VGVSDGSQLPGAPRVELADVSGFAVFRARVEIDEAHLDTCSLWPREVAGTLSSYQQSQRGYLGVCGRK
jgi:hypothetical protein